MKKYIIGLITGIILTCVPIAVAYEAGVFNDVPAGQWYSESVGALSNLGIVNGYSDGSFMPGKNVSRAELSVMLTRSLIRMGDPDVVCEVAPTRSDIGREVYPVSYYYKRTYWLGSVFTADDCGEQRLKELFGGYDSDYTWGSSVTLKRKPWQELVNTFKEIGYTCTAGGLNELDCNIWVLSKTVKVKDLLKLKGYSEIFDRDDCVNCG